MKTFKHEYYKDIYTRVYIMNIKSIRRRINIRACALPIIDPIKRCVHAYKSTDAPRVAPFASNDYYVLLCTLCSLMSYTTRASSL